MGSARLLSIGLIALVAGATVLAEDSPLTKEQRSKLKNELDTRIQELGERIAANPKSVTLYSQRGDSRFFRGRFKEAVADYETMVELDPSLETSHWRRGIAYFYAGRTRDAARQFEIYDTFDDVDRENGIWRYLSQVRAYGREKAREGLLKYKKDDREPFPSVYKLFSGETTPENILAKIRAADVTAEDREKRLFYAQLYIGLNHAVEGRDKEAVTHLREAVANSWGPKAGGGPTWMWHVGRLHYEQLADRNGK